MSQRACIVAVMAVRILCGQTAPNAAVIRNSTPESSALLARASEKILSSVRRLPRYTCLETINRTYYVGPPERPADRIRGEPGNSCVALKFRVGDRLLLLDSRDRLRIEVAVAGEDEIHAWPAASRFDTRSIDQMIPSGPISSGSFGGSLVDVFANPGTQFKFTGRKNEAGRDLLEYSFRVPFKASHASVKAGREFKIFGYSGSVRINAATADLDHIVMDTDPLPPEANMCRARTTIDYHYLLVGDGEFLIPRQSELETFGVNANQTDSVTTFSACHEYGAESSLRFDDQEGSADSARPSPPTRAPLPPGVSLTLALVDSIDTGIAAAGDAVSAKVAKNVRAADSDEILVPAGAIARGRILQLRHQYTSSQFQISIRFDTLEWQGVVSPLAVKLDQELKTAKPRDPHGLQTRAPGFGLPPPPLGESGNWFAFPATRRGYVVPAAFKSTWTTLAQ